MKIGDKDIFKIKLKKRRRVHSFETLPKDHIKEPLNGHWSVLKMPLSYLIKRLGAITSKDKQNIK